MKQDEIGKRVEGVEHLCLINTGLLVVAFLLGTCLMIHVRYFCTVTPEGGSPIADLSFKGMVAMHDEGYLIRVLPLAQTNFVEKSRWEPYQDCFLTPIPDKYINVVCGFEDEMRECWTLGVPNLALTLPHHAPPERYNAWFHSASALADFLRYR